MERPAPGHGFYLVDAFTKRRFSGNQAAVIIAEKELSDEEKQKLAAEFNLSETAFPEPISGSFSTADRFHLRWFTPTTEVPLCGHATLATAHIIFTQTKYSRPNVAFETKSGRLEVTWTGQGYQMDFPAYNCQPVGWPETPSRFAALGEEVAAPSFLLNVIRCLVPEEMAIEGVVYAPQAKKLAVVVDPDTTSFELQNLFSEYKKMVELHPEGDFVRGITVTLTPRHPAKQGFCDPDGRPYDYVCRYFAPWAGIDEDPATGSLQCALGPFYAALLNKRTLRGYQAYPGRGAEFEVEVNPEKPRVLIRGDAVTVVRGYLE